MSIIDNFEIFPESKRVFHKLSNDTNLLKIELQLMKIYEKDGANSFSFSLNFTGYFAQYL